MQESLLVVERDARVRNYIRTILADRYCEVITCDSGKRALEHIHTGPHPRGVLLSTDLSDMDCQDLIRQVRKLSPHINIAVMAYMDRHEELIEAIHAGAARILPKPFLLEDLHELVTHLTTAVGIEKGQDTVALPVGHNMTMVYCSPAMNAIQQQAARVACVNLSVLILGESGTGKEVLARYIHGLSQQAQNAFLKVNCAAVPSELLESELFGYEAGAFTGAGRAKPGKFRLCNNGTMFLDEIGEMHPSLQAKLLQVLQDGTFSPLGGRTTERVNVRIIAATNIDMKTAIANKTFREDLYYRLNGFCFALPPLRERREDIPALLRHFLAKFSHELGITDVRPSLSARMVRACKSYQWPGNLRELESFVKRYLVLGHEQLMIDELAQEIVELERPAEVSPESILRVLHSAGGNKKAAAKMLGISYKVLLHRMRQFGMEPAPTEAYVV